MADSCPVYHETIHGGISTKESLISLEDNDRSVCCEKCGTSIEAVRMSQPLGCIECYTIFEDLLTHELILTDKVAPRMKPSVQTKKSMPIHIGKSPDEDKDVGLSEKLSSMNEALNEALQKENYEQAAWLRDQIKALMEKTHDGKDATA